MAGGEKRQFEVSASASGSDEALQIVRTQGKEPTFTIFEGEFTTAAVAAKVQDVKGLPEQEAGDRFRGGKLDV